MLLKTLILEYKRDITVNRFAAKLSDLSWDNSVDRAEKPETVVAKLEDMDPTKHKQYTEWLVRQYISKAFRLEDTAKVKQTLERFERLKSKLPIEQRDVNRFKFHALEDMVDKHFDVEGAKRELGEVIEKIENIKLF